MVVLHGVYLRQTHFRVKAFPLEGNFQKEVELVYLFTGKCLASEAALSLPLSLPFHLISYGDSLILANLGNKMISASFPCVFPRGGSPAEWKRNSGLFCCVLFWTGSKWELGRQQQLPIILFALFSRT